MNHVLTGAGMRRIGGYAGPYGSGDERGERAGGWKCNSRVPEGRPGGWPSESVHPCFTLLRYVYLVRCLCLWDIVSCRVNRMHDARLLALRHC